MIDNRNTIIYIAAGKQILKPEDAYLAESCPRKVANVCHAMKLSAQGTQSNQVLVVLYCVYKYLLEA